MIINLKQINLSDSDNIKLDKINYNFDQLVANGGGPMGSTGPVGDQGATGITGAQGYQGPIGLTGAQGTPGANTTAYWKNIAGGGNVPVDTILPIHNPSVSTHPPVVSVGFISTDPEYGTGQNVTGGQLPYQWIINRRSNYLHNLRFTSSDVIGNSFNFRMEKVQNSSVNKFTMGFQNIADTALIWHAQKHIFIDNTTGNSLLEISDSSITYYKDVEFDRPVTVNGQLKIGNANAAVDKIAVAADNAGTVIFKSIDELGGIVPYGTIVSILPSVFSNNQNFVNSESVTLANVNDILKISVGKGINNYAGWYICNGKTWLGGTSQLQHTVPDLNSFSYTIQDNQSTINLNSQGSVSVSNTETHLVGGADINMTAVNPAPSVYGIGSQVFTTDTTISSAAGTTFKIKKLPQIIYLGDDNCYWQDSGGNQAPSGTNTYTVDDLNNTTTGSQSVTVTTQQAVQGSSFIQYIQVTAASGYYFSSTPSSSNFTVTSGYAVSAVTIGSGANPTTFTLTVQVTNHGVPGASRLITWNSSSFVSVFPNSTVKYAHPSWTSAIDSVTNGSVYQVYDLGTDPNSAGTLTATGSVTALTGTVRYIKYVLKADDYFYKFISPSTSNVSFTLVSPTTSNITVHSVTGNDFYVTLIIKDSNFGSVNPGGTTNQYAHITASATAYTDAVDSSGSGTPSGSFNRTISGSTSPLSISMFGVVRLRPGAGTVKIRFRAISYNCIGGGSAQCSHNGVNATVNFVPITSTGNQTAIAYPASWTALDNATLNFSGTPTINSGSGCSSGTAALEVQYSSDGEVTWRSFGA